LKGKIHQIWKNCFGKLLNFHRHYTGRTPQEVLWTKNIPWNLLELDSLLKKGLDKDIDGVTTPYLYIGAWKTVFAWHKEDLDLYSINYHHFGKPKCWYGIPLSESEKFDKLAQHYYPESYKKCPEFIRHKTFLINPLLLIKNGIKIHKCVQKPGEFVITFAGAYHAGFNMGYNCAEAVNFALPKWLDMGLKAKSCKCDKDNVKIDINYFISNINTNQNIIEENEPKKMEKKRKLVKKPKKESKIKKQYISIKCIKCNKLRKVDKNDPYLPEDYNHFECYYVSHKYKCVKPDFKIIFKKRKLKKLNDI